MVLARTRASTGSVLGADGTDMTRRQRLHRWIWSAAPPTSQPYVPAEGTVAYVCVRPAITSGTINVSGQRLVKITQMLTYAPHPHQGQDNQRRRSAHRARRGYWRVEGGRMVRPVNVSWLSTDGIYLNPLARTDHTTLPVIGQTPKSHDRK